MKKLILLILVSAGWQVLRAQDSATRKFNDTLMLQNIEVTSIRASDKAPFTVTDLSKKQLQQKNLGYDLPFLLDQTPSVVANSDAGNGIGYTNLRIRGSDATRINITLNGIPFNDAESQGTFLVDMPDIASSLSSVQIQRGVGTSTNGTGAFGATINLSTNEVNKEKYLQTDDSYGSFNTWKNTIKAGTGLIKNHFTLDARLSRITSDGYIDRAFSHLYSYYAGAAWINKNTSIRFNLISGKERTYQAWNGVPQDSLKTNRRYNSAGTEKPGTPYNNETDNYRQTHYQLFLNQKVSPDFVFNVAGFLIRGKGYYENYYSGQSFSKYGLPDVINGPDTVKTTDLILQQWLDNYFYGSIFSGIYSKGKTNITIGGGYTKYDGGHYNIIKWAQTGISAPDKYFNAPAWKKDFNLYIKWMQSLGKGLTWFTDIQFRPVHYVITGFKDHPDIHISKSYSFFNPKTGISYNQNNLHIYASLAIGSKEPNRDDFEADVIHLPVPERLYDWELGINTKGKNYEAGINFYYMDYKNQLINTGMINDVGAYTRINTPASYRAGIELEAGWQPASWIKMNGNLALSRNKIREFDEYIDDYDNSPGDQEKIQHRNTDISFSPDIVGGTVLTFIPFRKGEISLSSKWVGNQFLDNTSNKDRRLSGYFVENMRVSYHLSEKVLKNTNLIFEINNLFNNMYESNGYTYNYIEGGKINVENYYFPMAGINFMAGIQLSF